LCLARLKVELIAEDADEETYTTRTQNEDK
jgi:hypothetical protein